MSSSPPCNGVSEMINLCENESKSKIDLSIQAEKTELKLLKKNNNDICNLNHFIDEPKDTLTQKTSSIKFRKNDKTTEDDSDKTKTQDCPIKNDNHDNDNEIPNDVRSIFSNESEILAFKSARSDSIKVRRKKMQEDNSFAICLICDRFLKSCNCYNCKGCAHYFCRKCGKYFYEDKIEQGETIFTCPVFHCDKSLPQSFLFEIVSKQHYEIAKNKKDQKITMSSVMQNKIELEQDFLTKMEKVKPYISRNVIDVNNNEAFYMFNRAKVQICPYCKENSLFSKSGQHFIKCLNCMQSICKYCLKAYTPVHIDLTNDNHCLVFFRSSYKNIEVKTKWKEYLYQLLFTICGYVILGMGIYFYIYGIIYSILGRISRNVLIEIICGIVSLIPYSVTIPFILILFPYFPIITSIFN